MKTHARFAFAVTLAAVTIATAACSASSVPSVRAPITSSNAAGTNREEAESVPAPTVTVNFAAPHAQVSMSGFLNGQLAAHGVSEALLTPLKPALWRGSTSSDPGDEAELHAEFPQLTYVEMLSDRFGYPSQGTWNTTKSAQPPYNLAPYAGGAAAWTADVTATVAPLCPHPEVIYEEWNEPDLSGPGNFFYGSASQAEAVQAAAYAAVIKACANAVTGAPATVQYDKTFITGYLNYCLAHGCRIDFISLHEAVDGNIPQVAADLKDLRSNFVGNAQYAPLHLAHVYVDESVGPTANRLPGDVVAYLYYLEAGGADGAAKACWTSPSGASECFDGSVDGIIDPASKRQRAVWWAYKYYADGVGSRVASATTDPGIVAIGSSASATAAAAQVIVSAIDVNGKAPSTATPTIALTGLKSVPAFASLTAIHVRTTTIPDAGTTPVTALAAPVDHVVAVSNGTAAISVPLAVHTAVVMLISAK